MGKKSRKRSIFRVGIIAIMAVMLSVVPLAAFPVTANAEIVRVKIAPEYRQTVARGMLPQLNSWRAGSNWYYSPSNTKLYKSGLKALTYDYTLEQYAMQRAAEIAISFEHTRPKGDARTGLSGYMQFGENIAASTNVKAATSAYAMTMFKEEDKPYSGQGHRRMMLSVPAAWDAVGIACVYYKGCYYWAQIFGVTSKPNTTATVAVNGNKTMSVDIESSRITSKSADLSNLNSWTANLSKGQTDYLPPVDLKIGMGETWPHTQADTTAIPTWTSSNTKVVTVNSDAGTITAINSGTASTTMKEPVTGVSKSKPVSVTDPAEVTGVSLDKSALSLSAGATSSLKATVAPVSAANKNVTWSSSNTGVATVSSTGVVTAVKAGTATITAKTVSGGKTASCKVTVSDVPVSGVTLDRSALTLPAQSDFKLTANVLPQNAGNKNVSWSSSNTSVATVDSDGTVRGKKAGTAVITVRTVSGNKTASCTVTVTQPVTSLRLDRSSMNLVVGTSGKLTADVKPDDASDKTVTWSTSNKNIARVDQNGNITTVSPGLVTITAASRDGSVTATCDVRVQFKDVDSPSLWYYAPVYWAADRNITTGANGYFSPASDCTREQVVTFLWRMLGKPEPKSMNSKFSDVKNPSSYSYKAILWASENGIVTGSNGKFYPADTCTREQIVTIIWRVAGQPAPKSLISNFTDVTNPKSYSYKAILWASEKGITTGANGKFNPKGICKRREIVTFLYRYSNS
jgi:uncharacterized protein YjdB